MPNPAFLTTGCHCGAVRVRIAEPPASLNDCNCSLCTASGAIWGYLPMSAVDVQGATTAYRRADLDEVMVELRFCPICGATTHWLPAKTPESVGGRMGVNLRSVDFDRLAGIELRFPDGKAWTGDGAFAYRRPAIVIGADS